MRPFKSLPAVLFTLALAALQGQSPAVRGLLEGDAVDQASGAPLKQARVRLDRANADPIYARVDAHGHFAFGNLEPGSYQLTVDAPGFQQSRTNIDLTVPRPAGPTGVLRGVVTNLPASPQAKIEKTTDADGTIHATATAAMIAYAAIVGKVTDPYGSPMAGASVEIQTTRPERPGMVMPANGLPNPNMITTMVTADSRGEFRAGNLQPGTYWVVANKPNTATRWIWQSNYRVTYYPAGLDMASAQALKLAAGQQVRADIQVLKQSGVSVSGHLLGLPPQAADMVRPGLYTRLTLAPAQTDVVNPDSPFVTGQTDFEFKDVLPGRYTLWAQTEDAMDDPMGGNRKALFGLMKEVEIGPQDMAGFDLTMEPVKSLNGTVELAEGCSAVPAVIQLQGRNPLSFRPLEATVGADRRFTIPNVPPGRFTLVLTGAQPLSLRVSKALKGERDVLKEGLQSPWNDDEALKVTLACQMRGGAR